MMYFERYNDGETTSDWDTFNHSEDFEPEPNQQYCPFDPPPEVTGKAEPVLPTFEEWGQANVVGWNCKTMTWWRASRYRNCPDGNLADDVFEELEGGRCVDDALISYKSPQQARDALKAALLRLGRIRE